MFLCAQLVDLVKSHPTMSLQAQLVDSVRLVG